MTKGEWAFVGLLAFYGWAAYQAGRIGRWLDKKFNP